MSGGVYIGSSRKLKQRKIDHFCKLKNNAHYCGPLQKAWNKYGSLNFQIIEYCDESKLIEREQCWIDNYLEKFNHLYNTALIAGKVTHTPEVRAKMSAKAKLRKWSPAQRAKFIKSMTGKKRSPEIVEKIAMANRGQKRSPETRLKISLARLAKKRSIS